MWKNTFSTVGDVWDCMGIPMNFQRSTAKSPKIPGGWQHFATKFIEIEIFTLTDFSRQSCRCKQEFQGKKGKNIFQGARLENCTSTKSFRHSRTLCKYQFDRLPSPPPRADCRATNFFRQNPRPGDSFSVQNSGPRVGKTKQNPHPRA